jgi:hypothetical protein
MPTLELLSKSVNTVCFTPPLLELSSKRGVAWRGVLVFVCYTSSSHFSLLAITLTLAYAFPHILCMRVLSRQQPIRNYRRSYPLCTTSHALTSTTNTSEPLRPFASCLPTCLTDIRGRCCPVTLSHATRLSRRAGMRHGRISHQPRTESLPLPIAATEGPAHCRRRCD